MGVTYSKTSKGKLHMVDFGSSTPLGLYTSHCDDYDMNLVAEFILNRKISPFYKGLSDPIQTPHQHDKTVMNKDRKKKRIVMGDYNGYYTQNRKKLHQLLYSDSIECPICFLFYPANINFTRCCDQPICTECFVQIKMGPADYSNNNTYCSDIRCPYCMTEEFGIIYYPFTINNDEKKCYQIVSTTSGLSDSTHTKRRSIESSHPDVILSDHVRAQPIEEVSNSSNLSRRASSLQLWFHSRPHPTSLDRYMSSIHLETLDREDFLMIESIRQSIIEREERALGAI